MILAAESFEDASALIDRCVAADRSSVGGIESNSYLPGAVADHLTSFGGQLPTSSQMSALEWLKAGVTGSYGTAVEPYNFPTKFPETSPLLAHYFRGESLVEAYWK